MIRCKDIAAMVGVSRQAVTAVLNNSRPNCVSREKREEILRVAAEYNYRPDHAALALKTGKSNLIGIVMPPWDNPYIAELCMGIQRCLAARNHTPFFTIDNYENPVPGNLEELLSLHVAGMITVASSLLPDKMDIPVVSYFNDDPRFDSVCPDVERDSRIVLQYLKERGHRKIGYLGPLAKRWETALAAAAERRGLEFAPSWRIGGHDRLDADLFDRLLESNRGGELPTALIVLNDALALKVIRRIRDRGFRVPEDFSIIGYDDIVHSADSIPALTSVSRGSSDEIAAAMVDMLLERMEDPSRPRQKIVLKSKLIERETVLDLNVRAKTASEASKKKD